MIHSLTLREVATYPATPCTLPGLKTINYFFGANASGKTTISRVIADASNHPTCSIVWQPPTPLDCLVYNADFRAQNFRESGPLKGVFTLGAENTLLLEQIAEKRRDLAAKTREIEGLNRTLIGEDAMSGKRGELSSLQDSLADLCWMQKQKHDDVFKDAFTGVRNDKVRFRDKVLIERSGNTATLTTLDELRKRAESVFAASPAKEAEFTAPHHPSLEACESNTVWAKVVVGSADVPIAALIKRLGSGDWVNSGRKYLPDAEGKCPFCQNLLPSGLEAQLSGFFDQAYADDCALIDTLATNYKRDGDALLSALKQLVDSASPRLDISQVRSHGEAIRATLSENLAQLNRKQREPSVKIELKPIGPECARLKALLDTANQAIAAHNIRIANLSTERRTLTAEVWRYLLDVELKNALDTYTTKKAALDAAINGLTKKIEAASAEHRTLTGELHSLERQTTSVKPTMDAINKLLAAFGFTTFKLAASTTDGMYELQRANGTPVRNTLSDGESTFLTFLYFYHLIAGSENETGTATRRVVVFDDPISSLDSDVLFVVSSLVKNVFSLARSNSSHVAQVFVLTHNIYFHKEVTFDNLRKNDKPRADESFWIVRRTGEHSEVQPCATNPVKSSYDLLWDEVRSPTPSPNSICNAMRRILEHYFKLLGGHDLHSLYEKFEGEEKVLCRSLVSWMHDGSHFSMEDLHLSQTPDSVRKYLDVFRKVFETQNHESHYRMMMGDAYVERERGEVRESVASTVQAGGSPVSRAPG